MDWLSLTDPFFVGLVLDVTGAYILAKGLLISPQRVRELLDFDGEATPGIEESHFQDRIDAEVGLAYIAVGFMLQVVGYVLEFGGVHSATGTPRLVVGIGLALGTVVMGLGGWKAIYPI